MSKEQEFLNRGTGLLIVEVVNSNPNGDPDQESDPRQRPDGKGEISPVSFKRKLRDILENKEGPVWAELKDKLKLDENHFRILETRGRDRKAIEKEIEEGQFISKYWDGRVFGNTFLEEKSSAKVKANIKTGGVQIGMGVSIAPINILRKTLTNKAGVEGDKDRGMAPLSDRRVEHAIYTIPFYINPTPAVKSGCKQIDIDVLLKIIPHAHKENPSAIRSEVRIRHAWYIEHQSSLGTCPDHLLIEALTPKLKETTDLPSKSWEDYSIPTKLPDDIAKKVKPLRDLVNE